MIRTRNYVDNATIKINPVTGAEFVDFSTGTVAIGEPVVGGAPLSMLYVDNAGLLAQVHLEPGQSPVRIGNTIVGRSLAPDPLAIFGNSGLFGWWRATDVLISSGVLVSQLTDLSGNGRHLVQATPARQPALGVGPNATPALVFDGTVQVVGQQKTLRYSGAAFSAIGAYPSLWAIGSCNVASCVNLAQLISTSDAGAANGFMAINRRNTVAPQHFGNAANLIGASGGFDFAANLDNDVTHLLGQVPSSTSLFVNTYEDGVAGTPKAVTLSPGGLLAALTDISVGAATNADTGSTQCWGGQFSEGWLTTTEPTPEQMALLLNYSRERYGTA
jgi:hypothetical protein